MPVHPVSWLRQGRITHRRPALATPDNALYLKLPYQPLYRTAGHILAFSLKLTPDLPGAVHLVILIPHTLYLPTQRPVPLHPGRLGRGLSLRLDSGWGATASGADALWQRQDTALARPEHGLMLRTTLPW